MKRSEWPRYAIKPAEVVRMMREQGIPDSEIEALFSGVQDSGRRPAETTEKDDKE